MKNLLTTISFILLFINVTAQNTTEAKMAFQMAEEKFDAKQYEEALEFLVNAETAYGSINPPMAFLKVMILNQISYATEKTDKAGEALNNLDKALSDFDKTKGKEALGEDKVMEVYRIKIDFKKRKEEHEKWLNNLVNNYLAFEKMAVRLSKEFPKTNITVGEFVQHPKAWNAPKAFYKSKLKEKDIDRWVKWGGTHSYFGLTGGSFSYSDLKPKQIYMENFKTDGEGIDNIKDYTLMQFIKNSPRTSSEDPVTTEQLIELLDIPKELWNNGEWNEDTMIGSIKDWYRIAYESKEKKVDGEFKKFTLFVHKMLEKTNTSNAFGGGKSAYECLYIRVIENTL